jgi:hypothetical protein
MILIEAYMKENPVNGDKVKLVDPLDSDKSLTLNELYMGLSKDAQLQYPAPFQEVDNINEHVHLADLIYLDDEDYVKFRSLTTRYTKYAIQVNKESQREPEMFIITDKFENMKK